jgi:hypothetical protein
MKFVKLTVYLPVQKRMELKCFCAKKGVSMSYFVDCAIKDRLKKEIEKARKPKQEAIQNF